MAEIKTLKEVCLFCAKTVYPAERGADGAKIFHRNCLKCEECQCILGNNFAALNDKYYCKPHFKQLFALKGNYSAGFGEDDPKAKWSGNAGVGGFTGMQSLVTTPVAAAEPTPSSSGPSISIGVKRISCTSCGKTVYSTEQIIVDHLPFHISCFRCTHCNCVLKNDFAALSGKYYCKPHFKQLFAEKGNYSEGFGTEDPKAKWKDTNPEARPCAAADQPVDDAEAALAPRELTPEQIAKEEELAAQRKLREEQKAVEDAEKEKLRQEQLKVEKAEKEARQAAAAEKLAAARAEAEAKAAAREKLEQESLKARDPAQAGAVKFTVNKIVCNSCGKTVYEQEKIIVDKLALHRSCFRCETCKSVLKLGDFSAINGKYYCVPHYNQLFQEQGGQYGGEDVKQKWQQEKGQSESDLSAGEVSSENTPSETASSEETPREETPEEKAAKEAKQAEIEARRKEREAAKAVEDAEKEKIRQEQAEKEKAEKEARQKAAAEKLAKAREEAEAQAAARLKIEQDMMKTRDPVSAGGLALNIKRDKCPVCLKTVYETEKIVIDQKAYHTTCFKCEECKGILKPGNFASLNEKYYCKPHFKQLFALKGNYSEGFGEEDIKAKWKEAATESGSTPEVEEPEPESKPAETEEQKAEREARQKAALEKLAKAKAEAEAQAAARLKIEQDMMKTRDPVAAGGVALNIKRDKCPVCSKTVYETEKIVIDQKPYHTTCFKCEECKGILKPGNFASLNEKYYCKPHFKQLFALKGNYTEGFGEEDIKAKWKESNADAKPSSASEATRESYEGLP